VGMPQTHYMNALTNILINNLETQEKANILINNLENQEKV
jgi:hypothetical protein